MRNGRMRRIVELYEQGASKERVGAYLRRWLGWAGTMCCWASIILTVGCAQTERMHTMNEYNCSDISIINNETEDIVMHAVDEKTINNLYTKRIEIIPGEHVLYIYYEERKLRYWVMTGNKIALYKNFEPGKIYKIESKVIDEKDKDSEWRINRKLIFTLKYERDCSDIDIKKRPTKKDLLNKE